MEYDNGLKSDEEYEIDNALLAGNDVHIWFVLLEFERVDEPRQSTLRSKWRKKEISATAKESVSTDRTSTIVSKVLIIEQ